MVYRIYEKEGKRFLQHGTTLHGSQYIQCDRRREAQTYYHITAPAGELLSRFSSDISDVGLIGLGAGSLVTYISEKQSMDILELDPYNGVIARTYFYFLKDCPGKIRLFFGDGRLNLRKRTDRKYSVLIIDAFNSDAIPVHLLTCEALSEYLDRLDPDGIVLFHISNKYLDLSPVLLSNGKVLDLHVLKKSYSVNVHPDAEACEWVVLTRSSVWVKRLTETLQWTDLNQVAIRSVRPWTDQYTNLLAVIR
jgi:spermidine synthase